MNYIFRNATIDYAKGGSAKALTVNLELIREVIRWRRSSH